MSAKSKDVILVHLNKLGVHYVSPVSFVQCRNRKGVRLPFDALLTVGGRMGLVSTMEIPDEDDYEHSLECRDNNTSRNKYARSIQVPILYLRRKDRSVHKHLERFVKYVEGSIGAHAVMVDHPDAAKNMYGDDTEAVLVTDKGEIVIDIPADKDQTTPLSPPVPPYCPFVPIVTPPSTTQTETRTKTTTTTTTTSPQADKPTEDVTQTGESKLVQVAEVVLEKAVEILVDKAMEGDGVVRKTIADKPTPNSSSWWLTNWLAGSSASSTPAATPHSSHHHLKGSG